MGFERTEGDSFSDGCRLMSELGVLQPRETHCELLEGFEVGQVERRAF